jgi:hypothetical protein
MIALHPKILKKNGKNEFAILAFDEFEKIQEELQNFEDLKELREAKEKEGSLKGLSLLQAKEQLHI